MATVTDIERDIQIAKAELDGARAMHEHHPTAEFARIVAAHEMNLNILLDALPRQHEV